MTGGVGFIGSAVARALDAEGHEYSCFDRTLGQDIRDDDDVLAAVYGCDAVIHLAGVLGTHELFDTPQLAIDVNVSGTLNVLEACKAHGAAYVGITMPPVFPSSVHGDEDSSHPARQRLPPHVRPPGQSHVRAFNAFGTGQRHGEGHPRKIVPSFATQAWAEEPIGIWGDGEQTVDLIHVDDLGRILVRALKYGDDETFDGGTGIPFTVNEVADMVLELTGSRAGKEHMPMRRGETPTRIVASGENWHKLDCRPPWRPEAFKQAVCWYMP